jgi:hypothetical protein
MVLPPNQYQPTFAPRMSLTYFPLCAQLYPVFLILIHWIWDSHLSLKGMSDSCRVYANIYPTSVDPSAIAGMSGIRTSGFPPLWLYLHYTLPASYRRHQPPPH